MEEKTTTPKERVELEKFELEQKLHKLLTFFDTRKYHSLDEVSQSLLQYQVAVMQAYVNVLKLRLKNWQE